MPVGDVVVDEGDGTPKLNLLPKDDGVVILAQLLAHSQVQEIVAI